MSFDQDAIFLRVQSVFQDVFSMEQSEVTLETSLANTQAWDSLQHMQLVMSLESQFSVRFEMNEIIELQSIEQILEALKSKDSLV